MTKTTLLLAALTILLRAIPAAAATAPPDDRFIAGYAAAVLEHDFHLAPGTLTVEHGAIQLVAPEAAAADRARIVTALKRIPGVTGVQIVNAPPASRPAPINQPAPTASHAGVQTAVAPPRWRLFAPTSVFQPLLADPRWPNFSASYHRYIGKSQPLQDAADVSFGESFSLYQDANPHVGTFELGVQAAVFATFNLDAPSKDLVNADYFGGPILEYRRGDFSGLLRVYHQSSHLGDEFILDHPGVQRVNLSYEEADAILSYDLFGKMVRIYGGGGYLFDRDPSSLKPWAVQYGVEFRGPRIFPSFAMIPIAAVDLQNRQEDHWGTDVSARAGVEFQDPATLGRRVQVLIEYYSGHSPNGQFFHERIQFIGAGLHFYL